MNLMKMFLALAFLLMSTVPVAATAQTADDVILNLLQSLEGPLVTRAAASFDAAVSATATPVVIVAPTAKPASPAAPAEVVLTPFHLFDLDSNAPKPDPQIETLKAQLAAIIAQFAAVSASSTPAASVAASSGASTSTAADTAKPKKTFLRDLGLGARGEDVRQLQTLLIARGFLFGDVTGYFGILTKTAVISFQTEQGLPGVGNVGPRTRALLNAIAPSEFVIAEKPPQSQLPAAIAFIASSTSAIGNASSTAGTSTPATGTSTIAFDPSAPPISISMSILPTDAPVGGTVAVTWISQNADSCEASDGWGGPKPTLGAAQIGPLEFSLHFVLTCTGAGGVASTSALVVVGGAQ